MFGSFRAGRFGLTVAAGGCLLASMGVSAQAQEAAGNCGCTTALPQAGQMVGQLVSATGTVNVLAANGWSNASAGTPLFVGSRIETGAQSSASVQIGNCALPVGEQSQISVQQVDQSVCVAIDSTQPSFEYGQAGSQPRPAFGVPELLFTGTAGVVGGMAVATDDNTSVSP